MRTNSGIKIRAIDTTACSSQQEGTANLTAELQAQGADTYAKKQRGAKVGNLKDNVRVEELNDLLQDANGSKSVLGRPSDIPSAHGAFISSTKLEKESPQNWCLKDSTRFPKPLRIGRAPTMSYWHRAQLNAIFDDFMLNILFWA